MRRSVETWRLIVIISVSNRCSCRHCSAFSCRQYAPRALRVLKTPGPAFNNRRPSGRRSVSKEVYRNQSSGCDRFLKGKKNSRAEDRKRSFLSKTIDDWSELPRGNGICSDPGILPVADALVSLSLCLSLSVSVCLSLSVCLCLSVCLSLPLSLSLPLFVCRAREEGRGGEGLKTTKHADCT